jgi:hypothetical protein
MGDPGPSHFRLGASHTNPETLVVNAEQAWRAGEQVKIPPVVIGVTRSTRRACRFAQMW